MCSSLRSAFYYKCVSIAQEIFDAIRIDFDTSCCRWLLLACQYAKRSVCGRLMGELQKKLAVVVVTDEDQLAIVASGFDAIKPALNYKLGLAH